MWSIGIILYMLLTHESCFTYPVPAQSLSNVCDALMDTFTVDALLERTEISAETKNLVLNCLQTERQRLSLEQLLSSLLMLGGGGGGTVEGTTLTTTVVDSSTHLTPPPPPAAAERRKR